MVLHRGRVVRPRPKQHTQTKHHNPRAPPSHLPVFLLYPSLPTAAPYLPLSFRPSLPPSLPSSLPPSLTPFIAPSLPRPLLLPTLPPSFPLFLPPLPLSHPQSSIHDSDMHTSAACPPRRAHARALFIIDQSSHHCYIIPLIIVLSPISALIHPSSHHCFITLSSWTTRAITDSDAIGDGSHQ